MSYNSPGHKKAKRLLDKALKLHNKDKNEKALELNLEALRIFPNFFKGWIVIGNIYEKLGNQQKFIESYLNAIGTFDAHTKATRMSLDTKRRNYAILWSAVGIQYFNLNKYSNSLYCFEKAMELDGDHLPEYHIEKYNYLKNNKEIKSEISDEIKKILPDVGKIQSEFKNFEEKLIDFIAPYQKVTIDTIAEHFFPAPVSYQDYWRNKTKMEMAMRQGWTPEPLYIKTANTVEQGTNTIKNSINRLIEGKKIPGFIRPIGEQLYYIIPEDYSPSAGTRIKIDKSINIHARDIKTGDITINKKVNYCSKCGYEINPDWKSCPSCSLNLEYPNDEKFYCQFCGKNIQSNWKTFPYCSTDL